MAGLVDPEEDVVLRALASLRDAKLSGDTFDQTIVQRLRTLFAEYGRYVRAAAATTARSLIEAGHDRAELVALVDDGKRDRSAIVRSAAVEDSARA